MIIEVNREKERVSLGLKQTTKNPWDDIEHKFPVGAKVHGKVVNLVPYGAFVEIEPGVEGLVHITEMSWTKRITKPSELLKVGQELDAVVLGIQKDEQKISLGLRQLEPNPWDMVRHNYPMGARVRGKVRNMTTYGAFIELEEGIDGMVHVSDMSWTRKVNHPSEVLKKGDEVDAIVLDVDPNQQRISLGMKQLAVDPWTDIDSFFKIGDVVKGTVTKITSFGAFVELKDGIDGLVHISQISEERIEKVKDVLKPGQEVTARVIKIDRDERRLGLSIKAANYSAEQLAAETGDLRGAQPRQLRRHDEPRRHPRCRLGQEVSRRALTLRLCLNDGAKHYRRPVSARRPGVFFASRRPGLGVSLLEKRVRPRTACPDMGNPAPVLVTAFGPFGGRTTNASSLVLQCLSSTEAALRTRTFPVDLVEAPRRLVQAVNAIRPRAIILLGEAGNASRIRLESRAWNELDFAIPDVAGRQPRGQAIVPGAGTFLETKMDLKRMAAVLAAAGHDVELSTDPGRYLCNRLYYAALSRCSVPCVFVHLPLETRLSTTAAAAAVQALIAAL